MPKYLAAHYYNGLTLSTMRLFNTKRAAFEYLRHTWQRDCLYDNITSAMEAKYFRMSTRVWVVSAAAPPKLIRK